MIEMAIALALLITLIQASLWLLEKLSFKSWADNTTAQIAYGVSVEPSSRRTSALNSHGQNMFEIYNQRDGNRFWRLNQVKSGSGVQTQNGAIPVPDIAYSKTDEGNVQIDVSGLSASTWKGEYAANANSVSANLSNMAGYTPDYDNPSNANVDGGSVTFTCSGRCCTGGSCRSNCCTY